METTTPNVLSSPEKARRGNGRQQPAIFEWYENRVEEALQVVYARDIAERQKIVQTIHEIKESDLFWRLFASYQDEYEGAKGDSNRQFDAQMAFLSRMYIAGSLHGFEIVER